MFIQNVANVCAQPYWWEGLLIFLHLFWQNCIIYRGQNYFPCFRAHPACPLCPSPGEPKHCRGHYTNSISSSRLLFSKLKHYITQTASAAVCSLLPFTNSNSATVEKSWMQRKLQRERKHIGETVAPFYTHAPCGHLSLCTRGVLQKSLGNLCLTCFGIHVVSSGKNTLRCTIRDPDHLCYQISHCHGTIKDEKGDEKKLNVWK